MLMRKLRDAEEKESKLRDVLKRRFESLSATCEESKREKEVDVNNHIKHLEAQLEKIIAAHGLWNVQDQAGRQLQQQLSDLAGATVPACAVQEFKSRFDAAGEPLDVERFAAIFDCRVLDFELESASGLH